MILFMYVILYVRKKDTSLLNAFVGTLYIIYSL